jgi:ferrous iron transport protein B
MITLFDLAEGEGGIIIKIKGRGQFRQRLMEMGFIAGKHVSVVKKAPLGDPVEYKIMGYHVSLRSSEARLVEVETGAVTGKTEYPNGIADENDETQNWIERSRTINVALVGNPNSGKTSLFNFASGSREKVANYAGVTIDSKTAEYRQAGYTFQLIDLPGTYSLKSYSPEEIYIRNYIFDKKPDIILNIVDASNLERNLYLTTQLIDMGVQVVIALNMYDELIKRGDKLDHKTLGELLGVPAVPTISTRGKGISKLFDKIIEVYENREPTVRHIHINYGAEIERAVCSLQAKIKIEENRNFTNLISARYLALELLESEEVSAGNIRNCVNSDEIIETASKEKTRLGKLFTDPLDSVITDLRYGFISGALRETLRLKHAERLRKSQVIDNYLTNKYLGIPIFIVIMWITFFVTFKVGAYPKYWLELGVSELSGLITNLLAAGIIRDFLTDGIISGVGGVVVFLPNIILLFLMISMMEDTGYMARSVFIMDKVMHRMGLHGKSFIPLFMGFGCNVPAILATRIIESKRDRLVTMLITPFMSCSARLPVYILFIGAFFSRNHGLILLGLYLMGAVLAIISAIILKKVYFRGQDLPFVMELPPYRMPTLRSIFKHVVFRTGLYLRKIGGIILLASIIVWFFSNFPRNVEFSRDFKGELTRLEVERAALVGSADVAVTRLLAEKEDEIGDLVLMRKSEQQEKSIMGYIGRSIEPVMQPLGFDWRLSISILSGVAAKEVVVSTLGVLYHADTEPGEGSLSEKLRSAWTGVTDSRKAALVAFSFMLFILTYFPCIGVVAAIRRESGSWKWAAFVVIYTTSVAWLLSFIVYQTGSLLIV